MLLGTCWELIGNTLSTWETCWDHWEDGGEHIENLGNMVRNTLPTWETCWDHWEDGGEHVENSLGTRWGTQCQLEKHVEIIEKMVRNMLRTHWEHGEEHNANLRNMLRTHWEHGGEHNANLRNMLRSLRTWWGTHWKPGEHVENSLGTTIKFSKPQPFS